MRRLVAALCVLVLGVLALPAAPEPEPTAPKPINLDKLNTRADEDEPFLASNGLQLYYSQKNKDRFGLVVSSRRTTGQPWPPGHAPDGYFPEKADVLSGCLTAEGRYPQYLYFATNHDPEQKSGKGDNFDVYVTVRQNAAAAWTAPTPVQGIDTAEDEKHPWLTAGGKELYFSRKTKDGWRVYAATSTGAGAGGYANPKVVDLPVDFHHATLTPDGKTMYLQGPLEKNRWGLFRSTWTARGWSKPEALDELNDADGPVGDCSPALSHDGRMLYFASDRPGGKGGFDLWVMPTAQLTGKPMPPK